MPDAPRHWMLVYLSTAKDLLLRNLPWVLLGGWVCFRWHWGAGLLFVASLASWVYAADRKRSRFTPLHSVPLNGKQPWWTELFYYTAVGLCLILSAWTTYMGFHDVFGVNDRLRVIGDLGMPFALIYSLAVTSGLVYIVLRIRTSARPLPLVGLYLFVDIISVFSFNYLFFHERLRDEIHLEKERVVLARLANDMGAKASALSNESSKELAGLRAQLQGQEYRLAELNSKPVPQWRWIPPSDTTPGRSVPNNPYYPAWVRDVRGLEESIGILRSGIAESREDSTRLQSKLISRLEGMQDSLSVLQFERDRQRVRQLVRGIKERLRMAAQQDSTLQPVVMELFQEPVPYVDAIARNYVDAFRWLAGGVTPEGSDTMPVRDAPAEDAAMASFAGTSLGRWMAVLPALILDLVPLFLSLAFRRRQPG